MTRLTVIAGPTAVGKGTVVKHLLQANPDIQLSVSATTRLPRVGEVEGVDYFFVSNDKFDEMIANNELLEYAVVHQNNKYGTPRKPVEQALSLGKQIILEIDIQGAEQVKRAMPSANLIFIKPPSFEELKKRLIGRGTESQAEIEIRLKTAILELQEADRFDHQVINSEVAQCAQEVLDLMNQA
jgi:guanylate kinase